MAESAKETEADKISTTGIDQIVLLPTITDQEKELAFVAFQEFEKGNYNECLASLDQLLVSRPNDHKVFHNKAVVEYYISGFKNTNEFQKVLADLCTQAHISLDNIDALEDVDYCVIFFNYAVILFHLHQYYTAINILEKLYQFIEPIDENLSRKICFLLLELYICTYQPEKGLTLISNIEAMLFGNKTANENKTQTADKDKDREKDKEKEGSKEKEIKDAPDINPNEVFKPKLQYYKARCYNMSKSTKFCKREIKSLMNSGMNVPASYLRSQLEYLRGSYRKALKVLNSSISSGTIRSFKETGDNIVVMYYNDVGCIHFYMGKPNLASFYFTKALQEYEYAIHNLNKECEKEHPPSRPLPFMNMTARYHLLYNLGIQYLHVGLPEKAFDCLIEAVRVYRMNPRLWLRLSECCIQATKPASSLDFHLNERKKDMVREVIGSGIHRKIILSPYLSNNYKISDPEQTSAMPAPTLEFASFCLSNALMFLHEEFSVSPSDQTSYGDESESSHPLDQVTSIITAPSSPIQGTEMSNLRNYILISSAYVSLCLGDIVVALKHAETLLNQPRISGAHKLLGHLYAAEALILMDRIADAIQHLNPENIKDVSFTLPVDSEVKLSEKTEESNRAFCQVQNWSPSTVNSAKMIMLYNMAVAYTLRGELEKAAENLRLVGVSRGPGTDIPVQSLMLAMYIQLQQGHADLSRSIIKQHLPQYR